MPPRWGSSEDFPHGAVAQLGERCVRNAEVGGSTPLRSTLSQAVTMGCGIFGDLPEFMHPDSSS